MDALPTYLTITTQPSEVVNKLISQWNVDKIGVLVDEHTHEFCLPLLNTSQPNIIQISSGEARKTLTTCEHVWNELTKHKFTRNSLLINLGGGVIGDMGGFVASTYKRGMKFINVPTTLLAQVDASLGGKLGVDFGPLKNHIGLFRDPNHVIVSTGFLDTLPDRELRSGYAEVIKHGLIADQNHWKHLHSQPFEKLDWNEIIPVSIAIKNNVVSTDPFENGFRKVLNFGHTLGHALESHFLHGENPLLHGEAIAIGMILESYLSVQKELLTVHDFDSIANYIHSVFTLPSSLPEAENLMNYLAQDKKNDASGINFSLLDGIGQCIYDQKVTSEMIDLSLRKYSETI